MSMTYQEMQVEVARRATRNQGGTTYTTAIQNAINQALFRIAREANWRVLRRKTSFNTVTSYTKGTGAVVETNGSVNISVPGATFLTDGIQVGRKVKFGGYGLWYRVATITGETTFTIDSAYSGANSTTDSYEILPQEEYNLPPQVSHRMFMWHEAYGYPFKMTYLLDQEFYETGLYLTIKYIPTHYRMWSVNDAINQPLQPSVMTVVSTNAGDASIPVTIFGQVNGFPDSEIILTNGLIPVSGSKTFSSIERVSKGSGTTTLGLLNVTDSQSNLIATIPVGNTTSGITYNKVQLYPLPTTAFPMRVEYYKDPYKLVNVNDVHELGQQFDEAIILLATAKIKAEQNQAEGETFYELFKDELTSIKKSNLDKIDYYPKLKRPGDARNADAFVSPGLLFRQAGAMYGPRSLQ